MHTQIIDRVYTGCRLLFNLHLLDGLLHCQTKLTIIVIILGVPIFKNQPIIDHRSLKLFFLFVHVLSMCPNQLRSDT